MNERRRRVLTAVGAALSTGLAGCSGDGGSDGGGGGGENEDSDSPTATDTPVETDSPTPSPTDPPTRTATEGDGGSDGGYGGDGYGDGGDGSTATPTPTGASSPTATAVDAVALAVDNDGTQAWVVTEDESGGVAATGEPNPTMTFEVGTRYAVENNGWDFHPFALRAADDSPLVTQAPGRSGPYEDDDAVDWVDEGETFAFTMTEALAADLDYYICTVHSSMRGDADAN